MSNWIRKLKVTVGSVVVEDLRVEFEIQKDIDANPNNAKVRIFNLKKENRKKIKDEFKNITVEGGYEKGVVGLLHVGEIRSVINKREGHTDVVTEITSGDADLNHRFGKINQTFPASATAPKDLILALYGKMIGVKLGVIQDVDKFPPLKRPYTMAGTVVGEMNKIARHYNLYWSIQNGYLEVISKEKYIDRVHVISKDTGMVGTPDVTELGVHVVTLLNHNIRPKRLIKVISEEEDASGLFRVNECTYLGCNLDGDFFCDIQAARLEDGSVKHEQYKKDI